MMEIFSVKNLQAVPFQSIPLMSYEAFMAHNTSLLDDRNCHCVNYYGFPYMGKIKLICCVADDEKGTILVSSAAVDMAATLPSFSNKKLAFHVFEREIHENFGICYTDHPWLKPLRFAFDRADKSKNIGNYPFYTFDSDELHEVAVGPIHAGVIEPGHFRFLCKG